MPPDVCCVVCYHHTFFFKFNILTKISAASLLLKWKLLLLLLLLHHRHRHHYWWQLLQPAATGALKGRSESVTNKATDGDEHIERWRQTMERESSRRSTFTTWQFGGDARVEYKRIRADLFHSCRCWTDDTNQQQQQQLVFFYSNSRLPHDHLVLLLIERQPENKGRKKGFF